MIRELQFDTDRPYRRFLSKVPEVTIFFWVDTPRDAPQLNTAGR